MVKANYFETFIVPPSGGSLEIGNLRCGQLPSHPRSSRSPFGGIPRNWKLGGILTGLTSTTKFPLRGDP